MSPAHWAALRYALPYFAVGVACGGLLTEVVIPFFTDGVYFPVLKYFWS